MAGVPVGGLSEITAYTTLLLPNPSVPFPEFRLSYTVPPSLALFDSHCLAAMESMARPHAVRWLRGFVLFAAGAANFLCTHGHLTFDMSYLRALFHCVDMLHPLIDIVVAEDGNNIRSTLGSEDWCERFREFWLEDPYRVTDLFPAAFCITPFAQKRVFSNLRMWTTTDPRHSQPLRPQMDPAVRIVSSANPQKHQRKRFNREIEANTYRIVNGHRTCIATADPAKPHSWVSLVEWMAIHVLGAGDHHERFCLDFAKRRIYCRMWRERLMIIPTLNPPRADDIELVRRFYYDKPMPSIVAVLDHTLSMIASCPGMKQALAEITNGKWTVLTSVIARMSNAMRMVRYKPRASQDQYMPPDVLGVTRLLLQREPSPRLAVPLASSDRAIVEETRMAKQHFCRAGNACRKPVNFFHVLGTLIGRTPFKDLATNWCKQEPGRLKKCLAVMDFLRHKIFPRITAVRPFGELSITARITACIFALFGVSVESFVTIFSIFYMLDSGRVGPSVLKTRLIRPAGKGHPAGLCNGDPRANAVLWLICVAADLQSLVVPVCLPINQADYQREAIRRRLAAFGLGPDYPLAYALTYCSLCLEVKTIFSEPFPGDQRRRIVCMKSAIDQVEIVPTEQIGCHGVSVDFLSCQGDPDQPFSVYCERMPRDRSMTGCRDARVLDIDLTNRAIFFNENHYRFCPGTDDLDSDSDDDNEDEENDGRRRKSKKKKSKKHDGVCGILFKYDSLLSVASERGILCQRCSGRIAHRMADKAIKNSHLMSHKQHASRIRQLAVAEIDGKTAASVAATRVIRKVLYPCGQSARIANELNSIAVTEIHRAMKTEARKRNQTKDSVFKRKKYKHEDGLTL